MLVVKEVLIDDITLPQMSLLTRFQNIVKFIEEYGKYRLKDELNQ
jgi:hypothetical protein